VRGFARLELISGVGHALKIMRFSGGLGLENAGRLVIMHGPPEIGRLIFDK
jgi:hypothetical protein